MYKKALILSLLLLVGCGSDLKSDVIKIFNEECECDHEKCECNSVYGENNMFINCTNATTEIVSFVDVFKQCTYGYRLKDEEWSKRELA